MRRGALLTLLAALLTVAVLHAPAQAQGPGPGSIVQGQVIAAPPPQTSLLDWRARFTFGATLRHHWYVAGGGDRAPDTQREFQTGFVGAYNIVPSLSVIGGFLYGFDSRLIDQYLGISVPLIRPHKVVPS